MSSQWLSTSDAARHRRSENGPMEIQLLYFDGCPHWRLAEARLEEALRQLGLPETPEQVRVETSKAAEGWNFHGSPSVLIDGADPFAEPDAPVGLTCRLYRTPEGLQGAPTVEQLVEALGRSSRLH